MDAIKKQHIRDSLSLPLPAEEEESLEMENKLDLQ